MEEKSKKEKIIIYVLLILLVAALIYIAAIKINNVKENSFRLGSLFGYQQVVDEMIKQSESCKPVSVWKENKTVNFIDVECLRQKSAETDNK